jgi:predicted O-linked N-acetylglucosamine transferase (SPINDLY family)
MMPIENQPAASTPAAPDLLLQEALAHHQAGRLPQAEKAYQQILQANPQHPDALYLFGVLAYQVGQFAVAVQLIEQSLRLRPDFAEAYSTRGSALNALQQFPAAVESFDQAIRLDPGFAQAWNNRGNALHGLRQEQDALGSFDHAILLRPDYAEAFVNRGNVYAALLQFPEAIASFDRAIEIDPQFAKAYNYRGATLARLQLYQQALVSFNQALLLQPDYAEAFLNRANALRELEQYQPALESFDLALAIQPDFADAYSARGKLLLFLRRYPQALADFDRALELKPDMDSLRGIRLHTRRILCDWQGADTDYRQMETLIARGEQAADPFVLLALSDSPALQLQCAQTFVRNLYPARPTAPFVRRARRDKIRIGYFSADFREHAISYLLAEVFERHDRSQFEVVGFSFGPETQDAAARRVSAAMDQFLDVRPLLPQQIAQRSRELGIDIAVDLMGFTQNCRPAIFAERAAPVQVNYLGYPATMGAAFMDYILADATVIPEADRRHYTEKVVSLQDTFQANDSTPQISSAQTTRAAQGLPAQGFVFCCFNASSKIGPATFDLWMRILDRVPGSVLWLFADNPDAVANLRRQAAQRGVAAERLIFAEHVPLADHIARQRLADLFLDTLPFNAGATATPALQAGLPLLTCSGGTFAGRMAASLLRAIDLPELIAATPEAYESLAVELALNPTRLLAIRDKLARNRATTPLFDTARFTRNLEAAYTAMLARYDANLPPDHIHIVAAS